MSLTKLWWWFVAIMAFTGFLFFGSNMTGIGLLFILCAIAIAAITIGTQQKKNAKIHADEQRLWNEGIPILYCFDLGHFTGAYEYEQWHAGFPDSAGGWDVYGSIKNISPYDINYVHLYVYPRDRIGTKVANTAPWTYTGPFKHGKTHTIRSQHNWYDLSVASVEVEKIVVDYNIAGTQVATSIASFFALHGHGTTHETWIARTPATDGTWAMKSVVYYQAEKPSNRTVLYVVPLDANGNVLASTLELSSRSHKEKNDVMTLWWEGLWKGLPVAHVRIQKFKIEYTDGTNQVVVF